MDLKVQIPKRYKNTLSKRFNPKYAKYFSWEFRHHISVSCPLCNVYSCNNCPFGKFEGNGIGDGCIIWLDKIYRRKKRYWHLYSDRITFYNSDKSKAIKSLNWFKDRAEELIEWI